MAKYALRDKQLSCLVALFLLVLLTAGCQSREAKAERFLQRGKRYFEQQRYADAAIELRNAVRNEPRAVEARFYLALCRIQQRDLRNAYRDLRAVLDLQPSHLGARLALADLEFQNGDTEAARNDLRAVQAADARNLHAQILLAKTYLLDKDYARSSLEWDKAKQLAPQEAVIWSAAGFTNLVAKRYAAAESDFRHALLLTPADPECFRNLANLLQLTGRVAEAKSVLQQSVQRLPKSLELQLALANVLYREGNSAELDRLVSQLQARADEFPGFHRELGDFWLAHDELARAASEYERERGQSPGPFMDKKLISAYITLHRVAEAERLNATLLKQNPRDPEARAFQGAIAYLEGRYQQASAIFEDVLKDDAKSIFGNYYRGLTWLALGRAELAKVAFLQCLNIDGNFVFPHLRLAEIALQRNDWKEAEHYASTVVEMNPRMADGYLLLAQAQLDRGLVAQAESTLRNCSRLPALPSEYYELQARLSGLKKDAAGVNKYLKLALSSTTNPAPVLVRYTEFEAEHGMLSSAVARARAWTLTSPAQADAHELLARLYLKQQNVGAAEAACQKALQLGPNRWMSHFILGQVRERSNKLPEAMAEYEESIRHNPASIASYLAAANVAARMGQPEKAKSYYEAALRAVPDSPDAAYALIRLYSEREENLELALSMAQDLKKRFPEDWYVSDTLGWLYYRKRLFSLALDQIRPAASALAQDGTVQYHLGMTYLQMGKPEEARRTLQRALKLGITPPTLAKEAERALDRLKA